MHASVSLVSLVSCYSISFNKSQSQRTAIYREKSLSLLGSNHSSDHQYTT